MKLNRLINGLLWERSQVLVRWRGPLATLALFVLIASGFALVRASAGDRFAFEWPDGLARFPGSGGAPALSPAPLVATLLSWNTFGNAGTETTEPSIANDPNLSTSNLTLGAGIPGAANGNRFGGNNWFDSGDTNPTTLAESIAGNDFIEFIVTPNPGFSFTPTSLVFSWDRSGTGPGNVALRSSADSFATDLGTATLAASLTTGNTITISGLTNLTTATTFRLYGYGATGTTGTGGFDTTVDGINVQLNGTTADVDITFGAAGNLAAGTYHDVTINSPANVTLTGDVIITGTLTINNGGTLTCGTNTVSGGGSFVLAAGGTLSIGDLNGVTTAACGTGASCGNIRTTSRTFNTGASFIYTGAGNQAVGDGLPASILNLTIANTGSVGNRTVTNNANQVVTGTLEIVSGIYSSHSDYVDVLIDVGGTLSLAAAITVSGNWTNNGTFTHNGFGVTFDGTGAQTITTGSMFAGKRFAEFAVNKSAGTATLAGDLGAQTLVVTAGTFDQGASFRVDTDGAGTVATVGASGTWQNLGTGDLTLSGNVSNAGTINFNGNGTGCNEIVTDDISIRSSASPTQRTWTGTGTFSMTDVDVADQVTAAPPVFILVNSGVDSGNNIGWTFVDQCTAGTYTWVGGTVGVNTDWQVATNWNPARVTPAGGDILIFDGTSTPALTVTNVPTQAISSLRLKNGVNPVTLNAAATGAPHILTITGNAGLDIPATNLLTAGGANGLTVAVTTGSASTIGGQIILQGGAHALTGANAGQILFANGSIFTTSTGFSGHPFGQGTDDSVRFQDGSSAFFGAGDDPFGDTGNAIVTFTSASNQEFSTSTAWAADGRSYGHLTLAGASQTYFDSTASSQVTVLGNLTIGSSATFKLSDSSGGDLNLLGNFTDNNSSLTAFQSNGRIVKFQGGSATQTISKNSVIGQIFSHISISKTGGSVQLLSSIAINGQVQFGGVAGSAVDVLELNTRSVSLAGTLGAVPDGNSGFKGDVNGGSLFIGTSISPLGNPIHFVSGGEFLTQLSVDRVSGATVDTDLTIGQPTTTPNGVLTLTNGIVDMGSQTLTLNPNASISRTLGHVSGNLKKNFGAIGAFTFAVGTANGYSPVGVNVTAGTGDLTVKAVQGPQPNISGANALQRYWTLNGTGITADLTFNYLDPTDIPGSANESAFVIFKYDGSFSTPGGAVNAGANTATINGVNSFSDWTLAEPSAVVPGTISFLSAPYTDDETNTNHDVVITVRRSGGSDGAVSVNYNVTGGSATIADNDYSVSPASGTLNWGDGDTTDQTITINVKGDPTFEPDETVNLTLSAATGGATIGPPNPTTLTITNDDCPTFSTVYVDDSWVGTTPGTDPDAGAGPATNFGCDSFATIQAGINAVTAGGTVIVYAGNYKENPNANQAVTLQGPNVGVAGSAVRAAEANVITNGNQNAVFTVTSNNVTIDGFAIDGDDPLVAGAPLASTEDTNASYGVRPTGAFNHITVQNNIIKRVFIGFRGDGASQNNLVTGNWFDSIGNFDFGYGVSIRNSFYADVTNNKMTRAWTGVHLNNHFGAGGPPSFNIVNNEIHSYAGGILYWLQYNGATGATITNNNISAETGAVANNFGILAVSIQDAVNPTFQNNIISGQNYGVGLFNVPTSSTITLGSTNSISGSTLAGVFLTDNLNFNPVGTTNFLAGGPGAAATVHVSGVSITGNTGDGLKIEGTINTQSIVANGNTVTGAGGTNGVEVLGPAGTATLTSNTITGFATGIALANNSGTQTMSGSFNRLIGTTNAYTATGAGSFNATLENNWWGCNAGPGNSGCGAFAGTGIDSNPWIVLGVSAPLAAIPPGGTSIVTADMTHNSDAAVPVGVTTLPLPNASFTATNGTMFPTANGFTSGQSQSTFASTSSSNGSACATVDNEEECTTINVAFPSFSIDDVTLAEANSGTTAFTFTITKTGAGAASVDYATLNGTAAAPTDFTAITTTTLSFLSADTTRQVTVQVKGDTTFEADETFTVQLSNPVNATISDPGGLGTITNDDACGAFSTVYVDDSWAGTASGDDPDGGAGPATAFACDSFATIQEGINAVTAGGTVIVYAGSYAENVLVNKSVTLQGPNSGIDPNTGSRVAEAIVMPAATETSLQSSTSGTVFRIGTNSGHVDATIKGFTIDGHNPNLTGGRSLNGVEIHTGAGVISSTGSFDDETSGYDTTMVVTNNIIQNLERYGVYISGVNSGAQVLAGNDVSHNKIDNLPSGNNFGGGRGRGIAFGWDVYGSATYNVISRVNVGWQDDNHFQASTGAATVVSNNEIHTYHRGIFHNLQYGTASAATISDNNIFAETTGDFPASTTNFGIELSSISSAVGVTVTNNNATGNVYGILLWNLPTTANITISGGTLTNNTFGVYATNNDPQFGAVFTATAAGVSGVTITGATTAGIAVVDSSDPGATGTVALEVAGNTSITNSAIGISIAGPNASANVHDNGSSIHDQAVGIQVDGGSATITANNLYNNITGLRFINGGTATAHFNRIVSTTTAIDNPGNATPDLENNWWGCNLGPGNPGCGAVTGTGADFDPRIVLGVSASPNPTTPGGDSTVTADMTKNSNGDSPAGITSVPLPDASFTATNGTIDPASNSFTSGQSQSTFTSNSTGDGSGCATVDNQEICTAITLTLPTFSITQTVSDNEGDSGTTDFIFTVTRTGTTALQTSVDFATAVGATDPATGGASCGGGVDYQSQNGTLIFQPSDTTKDITIKVCGETAYEADETFLVNLSNAVGATITDAQGTGTIVNDDNCVTEFVVNSTGDGSDANPGDDICETASGNGVCTLRAAIEEGNALNDNCGFITVKFAIPDNDPGHVYYKNDGVPNQVTNDAAHIGVTTLSVANDATIGDIDPDYPHSWWRIQPLSGLPSINVALDIDGYTQSGASKNTKHLNEGDDAILRIEIEGSQTVFGTNGLTFTEYPGDYSIINGLVINHFNQAHDLYVDDGGGHIFAGNFLGVDVSGTLGDGTVGTGIFLNSGEDTLIGGDFTEDRNVISGHGGEGGAGIWINSDFTTVEGNYIGTDRNGAVAIPNTYGVIITGGDGNVIGCEVLDGDNVISGNTNIGVTIGDGFGNLVQGNFIGTDKTGQLAIPNKTGIQLSNSVLNAIGFGFGNVISGNTEDGVVLKDASSLNVVQTNLIGVAFDATTPLGNGGNGVVVYNGSTDNIIGELSSGPSPGARFEARAQSLGKAAGRTAKESARQPATKAQAGKAHVRKAQTGKARVGARKQSLRDRAPRPSFREFFDQRLAKGRLAATKKQASVNQRSSAGKGASAANIRPEICGCPSGANVIANNTGDGVKVTSDGDLYNRISQNSIYANGGLGINLVNNNPSTEPAGTVTANDPGDDDLGPNELQNFPVILSASDATGIVHFSFDTCDEGPYVIEFFASAAGCDPSGNGEGQTYLGFIEVAGSGTYDSDPLSLNPGDVITATATDVNGNTSEFSACFALTPAVVGNVSVVLNGATSVAENGATNLVYRFSRDDPSAPLTVNFSATGTADSSNDYVILTGSQVSFNGATGTVTFGTGVDHVDVTVDPTADFDFELGETVILTVTSGSGYHVVNPTSATGTITDDDCPTSFTVTHAIDTHDAVPGDGNCGDSLQRCTLRAAIEEANALVNCGTIDIDFAFSTETIIALGVLGQLSVQHNVNIHGPTTYFLSISGNDQHRAFQIDSDNIVSISNLSIIDGLEASGDGGGILNNGTLTLNGVTVDGNSAVNGGGIASLTNNSLTLINTTISGNTSTGNGGGLYNHTGIASLTNATIAYNTADSDGAGSETGGGIFVASGSVTLHNTIVTDNLKGLTPSTAADDMSGLNVNAGSSYNLIGTGSGGLINGGNNNQVGVVTALLKPLQENGGSTRTHALVYNSPAVDSGDDCVVTGCSGSSPVVNTDQRGKSRPSDGDNNGSVIVDIGAYERQLTETRDVEEGPDSTVDLVDAIITFPCAAPPCIGSRVNPDSAQPAAGIAPSVAAGTASLTLIDAAPLNSLTRPPNTAIGNSFNPPLPAFEVTTTATYTPPATVCFYLPSITDPTFFNGLRVLHREAGPNTTYGDSDDVLVDVTRATNPRDFASKLVCSEVNSFSAFAIAQTVSVTPTAETATVSGQILDSQGNPVEGVTVRMNGTQNRLTITDAEGKYHFEDVETNGFYVITPARANFTFSPAQRSFSQLGANTEATFTGAASGGGLNPLDVTEYFVRQQYLDFLGREPDNAGFNFWVNNIESCGNDLGCREVKRIDTSAAFFLSIESQQTGYLIYRFYQAAYGEIPNTPVPLRLSEYTNDAARISKNVVVLQNGWQRTLESNTRAFAEDFVKRDRFVAAYPITMTPAEFVDQLFANGQIPVSDGDHAAAIAEFGGAPDTSDASARARALRRIAENSALTRRHFNRAFVLIEYFGYLRRDPNSGPDRDFSGFNFWLDKLDRFEGNFRDAEMVKAFLTSIEYRARIPR